MKMPGKIDISMFSPCGMNYKVCYKHCYYKKPCAGCLNSDKEKPEYPCKLIENLEKSYNKRYQASSKCGGIISIHDKECSECQEKMK